MVVRPSCIPTSQHSTTWWSDHRAFPPVKTVPHGGQTIVHSHQSRQYRMVVRPWCIPTSQHSTAWWSGYSAFPPVKTVPHGGQIMVHSTSQHSTTWWSDHRAFHQSTHYPLVFMLNSRQSLFRCTLHIQSVCIVQRFEPQGTVF